MATPRARTVPRSPDSARNRRQALPSASRELQPGYGMVPLPMSEGSGYLNVEQFAVQ